MLVASIAVVATMLSCTSDDSSYGIDNTNITISGIDNKYVVTSFAGQYLEINPQIKSSFPEDDLEYQWSYYDPSVKTAGNTERAKVVSNDKNLKYEMNLLDGTYKFYLTVTSKSTGYGQQSEMFSVTAASALSKGLFILKEDASGNTDVDLYSTTENRVIENLLKEKTGATLKGKPRSLDVIPNLCYINPDGSGNSSGTCISITTDDDHAAWYRVLDMTKVMDETCCTYDGYVAGRRPYRTVYSTYSGHYLSSSSVFTAYLSTVMLSIGKFATVGDNGSSTHVIRDKSNTYFIIWNETAKRFSEVDYNGSYYPVKNIDGTTGGSYDNLECLSSGMCLAGGETGYFIMQDKTNPAKRWIYFLQFDPGTRMASVENVKEIESGCHLANSNVFAVNCQQASVIYCIDNNRLYAYDLNGLVAEKELALAGIPSGENVTYIANRFFNGAEAWDRLFVGTQNGDNYKIYIYNVVGGEPVGQPVMTIEGKGKLRKVDYADPEITSAGQTPLLDD